MKILFAAGGTGGHIFPAISIADEIKKMDVNSEILFIGAKGRIEEKIVPANDYELKTISISGFNRGDIKRNLKLPFKIIGALYSSKKILKKFQPNVVVGTGGFVSVPVIINAKRRSIPILLQEGNSFPGKATRYLSKKADKVIINFDETSKFLKRNDNVLRISHPIRRSLSKVDKKKALDFFGLNKSWKTLFVFGGSQGAQAINTGIEKIIHKLYFEKVNIIWQTGAADFRRLKDKFNGFESSVKIFEFIENMQYAYSAADLVICRAGISSIMELAYLEVPAILIPFPLSAENHQEKNARSLEDRNACLVIVQNEIDEKLYKMIIGYISEPSKLKDLSKNIGEFSDPDAAYKIAKEVLNIAK
ncbi:MAG: undecaprenyldiphospho-muramoylpentapeptide beta-N-acetylglucosaminyltransferase [Ignavibacteria bacterium]|nr:undecaprenyldiphospho-muramoylpentapeptide beta-N-acetylglucosaminyltransferase [Ignavibacteria bacterium]